LITYEHNIYHQEKVDSTDKNIRVDIRGLERRVEECVTIAGNSVSTVQARCHHLEEIVRNFELSERNANMDLKDNVSQSRN
jgi:hypothetical protein